MSDFVRVQEDEGVLEVRFCRADRKNALTLAMYEAAAAALREAGESGSTRAVVISGEGGHFTSGNDLVDFMKSPPTDESSPVFQFLLALRRCPRPVLAAVEGYAIGIGTTMLLHCDMAWADRGAQFRMPFVPLGLVPEAGSSQILPAIAGHRRAAELLYFGDFFDAEAAREVGIINDVVDTDVRAHALERARALAALPPEALAQTKTLLRGPGDDVEEAMRREAAIFIERLQSPEFLEAAARFAK